MKERLKGMVQELDSAIAYEEANDLAFTRHFVMLCKKRDAIAKALKKVERLEKRYRNGAQAPIYKNPVPLPPIKPAKD